MPDNFSLTLCLSEVARKLGFLGKKGFDIFGKIKLFAPRMKWETLKTIAVRIKDTAKEYETAFNGIKSSVENNDNFKQVGVKVIFCQVICGGIFVFAIDVQVDIFVL